MKVKYLTIFLIITLLFSGCKDVFQEKQEEGNQFATVYFSFNQSRAIVSEVNSESYYYTLTGYHNETEDIFCDCISYSDFISTGYEIEVGTWKFHLRVYSDNLKKNLIYEDTQNILIEKEISTVSFTLMPAKNGRASLTITLNYPENKGISYITAGIYGNVLAQDAFKVSIDLNDYVVPQITDIYKLTLENSSVTLNASVPIGENVFVKFFLYDNQSVCVGTYTESVFMINGDSIEVKRTLENINLFSANVYITNKDEPWINSGVKVKAVKGDKEFILSTAEGTNEYTGNLPLGTYDIYESFYDPYLLFSEENGSFCDIYEAYSDTGVDLTVSFDGTGSANLNYDYEFVTYDTYETVISNLTEDETLVFIGKTGRLENVAKAIQNSNYNISLNLYNTTGEYIPDNCFKDCTKLTGIVLPESVTQIGSCAFEKCSSLKNIQLPKNLNVIYERAFLGCSSLIYIVCPNSLGKINNYTFAGCTTLSNISLSEYLHDIGESAFAGCTSLTSIKIPVWIENIGEWVFAGCSSLQEINTRDGYYYKSYEGVLFDRNNTLICYPAGRSDSLYTISKWVKAIKREAFYGCNCLTRIEFADTNNWYREKPGDKEAELTDVTDPEINAINLATNTISGRFYYYKGE